MSNIIISQAETADAEMLKAISIRAFKGNFEKYGHYPPGLESLEWHQDKIKNGIYYKILDDKNLVGGLYMLAYPDNEMKIEYLFISPDYQGQKIGTKVMALIKEKYKEIKKWFLLTPYKDFGNHQFYEKLGYKKVGEVKPIENSEFKLFQYEKNK